MTTTILTDIKKSLGIDIDNLGFDHEILLFTNSTRAILVQIGVSELEEIAIINDTEWPIFQSLALQDSVKHYFLIKVKQAFDPVANAAIGSALASQATELEGRIAHEVEVQNVVIVI